MTKPIRKQLDRGVLWRGLGCAAGYLLMIGFMLLSWPQVIQAQEEVVNHEPTGLPVITGVARVGRTLTADTSGISDPNGPTPIPTDYFTYQWLADRVGIDGATAQTYTLTDSEQGKSIAVRVSYDDYDFYKETLTSESETVSWEPIGLPVITGVARVGQVLTADASGISDQDGPDMLDFTYQWLADDAPISAETGLTYTLADGDAGKSIKVRVSFTDAQGFSEMVTSAAKAVNQAPTGSPIIRGAAWVGVLLTADISGISDRDGPNWPTFTYQWLADDAPISAETGLTYTLVDGDAGKRIKVQVDFTDSLGFAETLDSAATAVVASASEGDLFIRSQTPSQTNEGRLVIYHNSQWSTVCKDGPFSWDEARVACRQLGYVDGEVMRQQLTWFDDVVNLDVLISEVACQGTESRLLDCRYVSPARCDHRTDVGVRCHTTMLNRPVTGRPEITGRVRVGETLSVDTSAILDPEGEMLTFTYEWWSRSGAPGAIDGSTDTLIEGAADSTYVLAPSVQGRRILVKVVVTDESNNRLTFWTAHTSRVDYADEENDEPILVNVRIGGVPWIFQELWADGKIIDKDNFHVNPLEYEDTQDGTFESALETFGSFLSGLVNTLNNAGHYVPVTFNFQWLADDVEIAGATSSTYQLTAAEVGKRIKVRVTYTDKGGTLEEVILDHPVMVVGPTLLLTGSARVGEELGVEVDFVFPGPLVDAGQETVLTLTYQWLADGVAIDGATEATYTLTTDEEGKRITVRVSFTDAGSHQEILTSDATDAVAAEAVTAANQAPTGLPAITGTAQVGEALSVDTSGITDADGPDTLSFMYQWLADGVQIDGATEATYTPEVADAGKRITVAVSFTDDGGTTEELTSQPTEAVVARQMAMTEVRVSYAGGAYTAAEGGGGVVVMLNLSPDPEREVAIPIVATTASTATASDYTISPMTVTFANGETSKQVTITAVDDAVDDDGESVTLGFGTLPNGVVKIQGADTVSVTLVDNDTRGVEVSTQST